MDLALPDGQVDVAQYGSAPEFLGDAAHLHGIRPKRRNWGRYLPAHCVGCLCTLGTRPRMSMISSPAPDEAGSCGLLPHLVELHHELAGKVKRFRRPFGINPAAGMCLPPPHRQRAAAQAADVAPRGSEVTL
jgi:hypothetical protein